MALKRERRWLGNLLAASLILVVAVAFGRQVQQWWVAGPAAKALPVGPAGLPDAHRSDWLQFGEAAGVFHRRQLSGDRQAALATLRDVCRGLAECQASSHRTPGPAESELLRQVDTLEPVEQSPGQWRMYQLDGPFPMVVVIRQAAAPDDSPHVLTWGLGIPRQPAEPEQPAGWTLFAYAAGGTEPAHRWSHDAAGPDRSGSGSLPRRPVDADTRVWFQAPPLPPGSRRTLAVQSGQGATLVGFHGRGPSGAWRHFFDRWFTERGWSVRQDWQQQGGGWHARFSAPQAGWVDVQWMETDGRMRGLLTVMPPAMPPAPTTERQMP